MRKLLAIGVIVIALLPGAFSAQNRPKIATKTDGLLAHDINGYSLDMTVDQVSVVAHRPLESIGGGQFQAKIDGIDYDFGFSVLGHLYRIDSKQDLGHFIPDAAYDRTLTEKLSLKFGKPQQNQLPDGPVRWNYGEAHADHVGDPPYWRPTVQLYALLQGGYGEPVTLNMHLIDFRIERRDIARHNATPKAKAEAAIKI